MAVLAIALLGVGLWAFKFRQHLDARTAWDHPLQVAVVLLADHPLPVQTRARWAAGVPALEAWFAKEFYRYRPGAPPPVNFHLYGPVQVERPPDFVPASDGWIARARHAWQLSRVLGELDARAQVRSGDADARLYVLLAPSAEGALFVEGVGAKDGQVGLVRAAEEDDELTLALTAVAHELLHCVGATDKYDADGHARDPEGLAEPDRAPPYPQSFAEMMVGELALSPHDSRLPDTLDEVRVGPLTAAEVKWSAAQR